MEPQLLTVIEKAALIQWAPSEWHNWQFEAKHDGARCLIVDGKPQSRTGKPLYHLEAVLKEIGRGLQGVVLDGEVTGENWADTMHNVRASKSERNENDLTFRPFDMLTLKEWKTQVCDRDLFDRQLLLDMMVGNSDHVQKVIHAHLNNYEEFEIFYNSAVSAGCDGVVLKMKHSMYEFKRVKSWLKVKPEQTFDCLVLSVRPGKLKYANTLGALTVAVTRDVADAATMEESLVTTNVSGMTDIQRTMWWDDPTLIVGKVVEVKARGVHKTGKLIEPRFIRIREDK